MPVTDEWMNKMWSIQTMERYSAFKRKEILGCPGRLNPLGVRLRVSAQVTVSWFHGFEPPVGLCADGEEPAWNSLSFSLSLSLSFKVNE